MIDDLFAALGICLVKPLGGRQNLHWLVGSNGEMKVLRRWALQPAESIAYERNLIGQLAKRGWPVAPFDDPIEYEGHLWSLSPFLLGKPRGRTPADQRACGRLLAERHAQTSTIDLEPRPGWRRCEEILADPLIEQILSDHESTHTEETRVVRWHLDRARLRLDGLKLETWPSIPIHGDFAPWNLRYEGIKLTGLLDFELARNDHRIADFALSWRGKYDDVILGYEEVTPLEAEERTAVVPVWWAELIEGYCHNLRHGFDDEGWTVTKLLARSQIMGPDARELP